MTPEQTVELETLARLVRSVGGSVVGRPVGSPALRVEWSDPRQRLAFLAVLAEHDAASDPRVRAIAAPIVGAARRAGFRGVELAAALLHAVQQRVALVNERVETFTRPAHVWAQGYGDCDDSACLVASLARSVEFGARLMTVGGRGGPSHVVAQLAASDRGPWYWAETTVRARLGEHPVLARERCGVG